MIIHKISIPKKKLEDMPERERALFFGLGHLANEINILQKHFLWCIPKTDKEEEQWAALTQSLVLSKVLAGKLYEGWSLIEKSFFNSKLSKEYESRLSEDGATALNSLRQYFNQKKEGNLISKVRNKFAFHYDIHEISKRFKTLSETNELSILLGQECGNSLYYASEIIMIHSLIEEIGTDDPQEAIDQLFDDITNVSRWQMDFIEAALAIVIDTHMGETLEDLGAQKIKIAASENLDSIRIPFFVN